MKELFWQMIKKAAAIMRKAMENSEKKKYFAGKKIYRGALS